MDEKQERQRRRTAIRLTLRGWRSSAILKAVARRRTWLSKWRNRYAKFGRAGLRSQSRRPLHPTEPYPARIRSLVVRLRRQLRQRTVGLIGAPTIQRELRSQKLLRRVPSASTVYRILHEAGEIKPRRSPRTVYYPRPTATAEFVLHALDWTARYLEGGAKVYAFHSLDLQTRACKQTISTDKTSATACAHALESWKTLGIPDGLQLDNDSAFNGGNKVPRVFGRFVRLGLYLGLELIFLPVAEPERNGEVEELNGLWAMAFWKRRRFASVTHVRRASPAFERWYAQAYEPPRLQGRTPAQAQQQARRRRLTERQRQQLPDRLPITAGRVHFIRKVSDDGTITFLNETWRVDKRLAGQYVWATVWTHRQRLEIYHRRSAENKVRRVKTCSYRLDEPVVPLRPEFKRSRRRRRMSAML